MDFVFGGFFVHPRSPRDPRNSPGQRNMQEENGWLKCHVSVLLATHKILSKIALRKPEKKFSGEMRLSFGTILIRKKQHNSMIIVVINIFHI